MVDSIMFVIELLFVAIFVIVEKYIRSYSVYWQHNYYFKDLHDKYKINTKIYLYYIAVIYIYIYICGQWHCCHVKIQCCRCFMIRYLSTCLITIKIIPYTKCC